MSALFYRIVRAVGSPAFSIASRPLVLHRERAARAGGWLLAANHESPFDAALLVATTPRVIYWLSIVELFQHPLSRWFLSSMGAMPLDRSRPDPQTVRSVTRHLRAGQVVGIFPEGGLRDDEASVFTTGEMKDGVARLAEIARVPVVPCVVAGGAKFSRWQNWLPLRRTRWAVAYGEPIHLRRELGRESARTALRVELQRALVALREEVRGYV